MHCTKKITSDLIWLGGSDRRLALFENVYPIPRGVSYNAYLIRDEKTALLDTVDKRKYDDWATKVDAVLDGRTPDYIVVHHLELDHAGSLQMTIKKYPEATLVLSAKARLGKITAREITEQLRQQVTVPQVAQL